MSAVTLGRHGITLRLHSTPDMVAAHWRAGRLYEEPLCEHIHRQRFTGTAIDVGAHVGNHTVWLAALCGLRVEAFEPVLNPELVANVKLNGLEGRVRCHAVALGRESGFAEHLGRGRLAVGAGTIEVRTLDEHELKGVALVKVDVEGMEADVLAGGEQTIRGQRPVIFAEEWDTEHHDRIAAVLEPWGYEMRRRFRGKGSPTPIARWDAR